MTLRRKLILAQTPLALALVVLGGLATTTLRALGERSSLILKDNYRSALAAQRMKEAVERIDSGTLFIVAGHGADAAPLIDTNEARFEGELRVQEGNITEPGEGEATRRLRAAFEAYRARVRVFRARAQAPSLTDAYFADLQPAFAAVKDGAGEILAINQDAMVRKSDRAERQAETFNHLILAAVVLVSLAGLGGSVSLTARLLRPLSVVRQAVRRFGDGDGSARARVTVKDEIGELARDFNLMADRLQKYRASSLGELLQAQQAAQAAIDALADPVAILDASGRLLNANPAATRVLGVDPDIDAAKPLARMDAALRAAVERVRAHVAGGKGAYVPKGFEEAVRLPAPEGDRYFLPRASPLYGEGGGIAGVAIVLQDVTRLLRVDELKNDLVATVAHELRTPLTSLRMAIHLCLDETVGPLTRKQADLLHAAREDCERLQAVIDDLLDLSRIEAGHIDLQRRRASAESLVDAALDVHRAAADERRIGLRREVAPGCPEVFADPDRLQLVFTNLITNALRYAPEGSDVTVRALPVESAVRFEVADQGPGIPGEHQVGLFEKFYRVPGSPEGGAGLGLFIAKGLVLAHGGQIAVDSGAGRGTTFWFTVPAAPELPASA